MPAGGEHLKRVGAGMDQHNVSVDSKPFECVPHWLLFDPDITANGLRVWLVLQKHRDYTTGDCWPGRRRLADLAHLSVKTVDRALDNLEAIGAVTVTARKKPDGSNASNLYQVHWDRWGKSDATVGEKMTPGVGTKTTHEQRPISKQNPRNEEEHPHFSEFWKAYPRKKDKGHARKAFSKAAQTESTAVIISGAVQFRQWCDQDGTEPQFIPYPASWLNGERWNDERDPTPMSDHERRMQGHLALVEQTWQNSSQGYPQLEG